MEGVHSGIRMSLGDCEVLASKEHGNSLKSFTYVGRLMYSFALPVAVEFSVGGGEISF